MRLTANKTKLYTLVQKYVDNLPPMRSGTQFIKYPRTPDYALDWITPKWDKAHAFFSTCMGRPLLSIETGRRKNPDTQRWEDHQHYAFRDTLPLGHGEKSLYLIQRHMDLEPEEALAIRWHMGAYDSAVKGGARDMGTAMEMSPWVWRLQQADMCATFVDEREEPEE